MSLTLDRQNAYRARYQKLKPGWQPATQVYESMIRSRLRPGMRVVDVGCGRGGVLEQLGSAVSHPVGIDPDVQSLREHRMPQLPRAAALASDLPIANGSVDLLTCSWVLEHLSAPLRVFEEACRVLRPGGAFIFLTPNERSAIVLLNRLLKPMQQWLVPRLYGRAEADTFPVQYQANNIAQIGKLADQARLQLAELRAIEDPTYLAFHPVMFGLGVTLARATPPVHLVGVLTR